MGKSNKKNSVHMDISSGSVERAIRAFSEHFPRCEFKSHIEPESNVSTGVVAHGSNRDLMLVLYFYDGWKSCDAQR